MYNEIMTELDNVFNTLSRISVSDIGVDLMFSAKEQLREIYTKVAKEKEKEKEDKAGQQSE